MDSCGVASCRTTLLTVGCHSGWLWLQQPEPFQVVSSVPEPKETTRVVPGATPQGDLVPRGAPSSWMQACRGRCPKIVLQGHWSCAGPTGANMLLLEGRDTLGGAQQAADMEFGEDVSSADRDVELCLQAV